MLYYKLNNERLIHKKVLKLFQCLNCGSSISFTELTGNIVRCSRCQWFNNLYDINKKKEKKVDTHLKLPNSKRSNFKIKVEGNLVLFAFSFNLRTLEHFRKKSPKSAEALENYILYGKDSLYEIEKNILYKLKAVDVRKLENKILDLEAKLYCVKHLKWLDF